MKRLSVFGMENALMGIKLKVNNPSSRRLSAVQAINDKGVP